MIGQLLVESTQALLVVGQGPLEDLPPFLAQGRGPVLTPCRRLVPMKTSMSPISIFVPSLAAWVWGQPVGRPAPHPRLRKTSSTLRRVVSLISGHQRPAATGDSCPRIIYGQGQDTRAHSSRPSPRHLPPGTTNKVTGAGEPRIESRGLMLK